MEDIGAGGEESVVNFDGIAILTPRGRYNIELHLSFLRLRSQANDFKIQYNSIVRVFWLPTSDQPHTFVVVTLDPPIPEAQTLYPHIVMQFQTDVVMETTLSMCEQLYNAMYKDKLKLEHKGLVHEIFTKILGVLSDAKVSKPGKFRSEEDDGYGANSSLEAEDGILFPLEEGFFFLPNPPTLVLHEEIDYVEFERHTAAPGASIIHYFGLLIKLKSEKENHFRNIHRNEFPNLLHFIDDKGLKLMHAKEVPTHLEAIGDESDDEEEYFVGDEDDGVSPTVPKTAMSAFMFFVEAGKENLVKSNPGISLEELARELGDRWNKMTVEEKSPYEGKAVAYMTHFLESISSERED